MKNDIEIGKLVRENEILEIIGSYLIGNDCKSTQINELLIKIMNEIKLGKKGK